VQSGKNGELLEVENVIKERASWLNFQKTLYYKENIMKKEEAQKSESSEKDDFSYYPLIKKNVSKFTQKLDASDNEFLQAFSQYLKNIYRGDRRNNNPDCNDKRMEALEKFMTHIYLLPKAPKSFKNKGCALLGETPFDKLDFTRSFLKNYGGVEYTDDGVTKNRYAIVDCEGKAKKAKTIESYAIKYRNVPFVIFNNCENILKNEDTLRLFKNLIDDNRKVTYLNQNDEFEDVIIKSWYILLGNENKLYEILEKNPNEYSVHYRVNTFHFFIKMFDLK